MPKQQDQVAEKLRQLEKRAADMVSQARMFMVMKRDPRFTFFSVLASKLRVTPSWFVPTAGVDGKSLYYNPAFICTLDHEKMLGLMAHEVLHCALSHVTRRGNRNLERWNIACDLAINEMLRNDRFTLPEGGCFPGEGQFADMPKDMTADWYYSNLPDGIENKFSCKMQAYGPSGDDGDSGDGSQPSPGHGKGVDPGGCGGVMDAPQGADKSQMEADWKVGTAQARDAAQRVAQNGGHGSLPLGIQRIVDLTLKPQVPWREQLRHFVSAKARNDFNWSRPNRRMISSGIYLPGLHSEELGHVVIVFDTSGSIGGKTIDVFAAEIQGILAAYDCTITVLFHDTIVQGRQEWSTNDGPIRLKPAGGGGTSHVAVFREIEAMDTPPAAVVCLTDGYTDYPEDQPPFPVIWAMTSDQDPPWGQTVRVSDI